MDTKVNKTVHPLTFSVRADFSIFIKTMVAHREEDTLYTRLYERQAGVHNAG